MTNKLFWALRLSDILIIRDKRSSSVLVWKVEKTETINFTLDFFYMNAVSLRSKKNNQEKKKKLRGRLFLQEFLAFYLFQ